MKKTLAIIAIAALFSVQAQAQGLLGSLLGGSSSSSQNSTASTIGNILGGLAGVVYSAPISLNGTYTYDGCAISASSSEGGLVSNIAGSAVSSTIEPKVDEYLAKVGIKPGAMTWVFNNSDNTFTAKIGGISIPGTYKVGEGENTVTLTFGKSMKFLSMTGTLQSTSTGAKMLFQADKLLAFAKRVASLLGNNSAEVSAILKLADGYDQFKVGLKLTK